MAVEQQLRDAREGGGRAGGREGGREGGRAGGARASPGGGPSVPLPRPPAPPRAPCGAREKGTTGEEKNESFDLLIEMF